MVTTREYLYHTSFSGVHVCISKYFGFYFNVSIVDDFGLTILVLWSALHSVYRTSRDLIAFTLCITFPFSFSSRYCTARRCSPLRRKFMMCSINSPALSLLMKHLVIGQRLKNS